jgi:uncharacterized protein (TIGR02118 family)
MAMMLVVYRTPQDPEAFDQHYFNVHVPLAKQLPGIIRYQTSKGTVLPLAGADETYRVGLLHFVSLSAIKEAFASDIGKACAADRRKFAPNDEDVQMFLFDDQDV